jgi:hypothetical protein
MPSQEAFGMIETKAHISRLQVDKDNTEEEDTEETSCDTSANLKVDSALADDQLLEG